MLIGHQKQWEFLKKSAEANRISQAYLFVGQEKLGKRKVALDWVSWLFNQDIQNGQHPDLVLISPENKEIQISQIRELIWKLSLKPYSAPFKAAIIDEAHSMNQEAQTAILKTLEDPKGKALLILISSESQYLFPTILSRVQIIKFFPVRKEEIKNYLKKEKKTEKEAEEISKFSLGRPGMAVDFVSFPKKFEKFQKRIKELDEISKSDLVIRFQYAKVLSQDPQDLRETLSIWLNYFRNILLFKISKPEKIDQHYLVKLSNIIRNIQNISFLISTTNVNPRLALENLMLEI